MTMSKRLMLAIWLAPLLGALVLATPAQAAPPSGGSGHHFEGGGRGDRGGDFRDHRGRDFDDHFGFGFGWGGWWGWDPYWYPYPYDYAYAYPPYPGYYAPPPPAPQAPVQASGAPPQQFWYHCDNPQGYYPYVANCNSAWRQVAPTPPSGNTITPKAKP